MDFNFSKAHQDDIIYYREFAENEVRPYVRSMDEEEVFPEHLLEKMREYKLFGIPISKEYGGEGKDHMSSVLCMEEISKVSPVVPGLLNVTTELVTGAILKFGTQAQKDKYVAKLTTGEMIGAFAITEAGAGSDSSAAKTKAVLDGDTYIINGTKLFITNAIQAGVFLIGAKTDIGNGKEKMSMFLIDRDTPGFRVGKTEHKMGTRASSTCELIIEDCRIPKENLLGQLGKGMAVALGGLDGGRVMIGAQGVGIAQGCIDQTVKYLKEHLEETDWLINRQSIQFKIAQLQTKVDAARLMVYRAATEWDADVPFGRAAALAKYYATDICNEVTRECIQIMGYEGCTTDYPVEEMYRNAKITEIYEGTNEIQLLVIAGLLGLKG